MHIMGSDAPLVFLLDALLDVLLNIYSPLNLERVPLKLVLALQKPMEYLW